MQGGFILGRRERSERGGSWCDVHLVLVEGRVKEGMRWMKAEENLEAG